MEMHCLGSRWGEANCVKSPGNVHSALDEYDKARHRLQEARGIYTAIGDRCGEADCIWGLGDVAAKEKMSRMRSNSFKLRWLSTKK